MMGFALIDSTQRNILYSMDPSDWQVRDLVEFCDAAGVLKKINSTQYTSLRLAYHPYRSTQKVYDLVKEVTRVWQKLMFEATSDLELVERVFKNVCKRDSSIAYLLKLIKLKRKKQTYRRVLFNFMRTDYFIDLNGLPKVIQYNLDSVSMHAHSENFQKIKKNVDFSNSHDYFPNTPHQALLDSMERLYREEKLTGIVLFINELDQLNIIQQRMIQTGLMDRNIRSRTITLDQSKILGVDQQDRLRLGQEIVEVVYHRYWYTHQEIKTDKENYHKTMETIELSNAIKVPDAALKLFNSKRMQTELSKEEVFSKYLTKEESEMLKLSVIRQWEFDDMKEEQFREVLKEFEKAKDNFVLKPNCEGGGNNLWGEEGYRALEQATPNERTMYILMEKIQTKPIENVLIDGSKHEKTLCDYEVSCFGVIQGRGKELAQNDTVGHLIRTKPITEREGGIFAGKGCLCTWARQGN